MYQTPPIHWQDSWYLAKSAGFKDLCKAECAAFLQTGSLLCSTLGKVELMYTLVVSGFRFASYTLAFSAIRKRSCSEIRSVPVPKKWFSKPQCQCAGYAVFLLLVGCHARRHSSILGFYKKQKSSEDRARGLKKRWCKQELKEQEQGQKQQQQQQQQQQHKRKQL